jgi:zinc protease
MIRSIPRTVSALAFATLLASGQTPRTTQPGTARPRPATASTASAPAPASAPSPRDLKYPALRAVEVPKVATFTLPNGMKLFLLEDRELPSINGVARIRTGNLFDPAGKVGVATLTGITMRTGGTRQLTGEQLDLGLEDLAASVECAIDRSAAEVSFFSLAENASEVLGAFHGVLTAPAFRVDQVDLAKLRLRTLISHRNDDANRILLRQFPGILYGDDSPYGWDMEYDQIDRIVRADLQAFHKRYFFPKNVTLAVWGDFETAKMKEQLEQLFAGWTVEQPPVPEFPKAAAKPAPGIYLAKKTDLMDAFFAIGQLGGKIGDKDYPALTVMAGILGGGVSSRLYREIVWHMGNAYNISAEWAAAFDHPGLFKISGSAKAHSIVATIKAIRQEVERIRTAEVSEDELRVARDGALNRLAFASDTRNKILNRMLTYAYFGYPADYPQQYQKALAAVTRADVLRVAKEYLRPADFTTLVVGNPEDFMPPLESLGEPVREIDLTIPEPKAHAAPVDTAGLELGKRILARLQSAVGGADKLAAVKDYTMVSEVRLSAAAGGETTTETDRWMLPGNIREDADRPSGKSAIYSDGRSGWVSRGRLSTALNAPGLKAVRSDLFRAYFGLLLSDRAEGRTVTALDEDTLEITTADGLAVQVSVSPETGLPQQFSYTMPAVSGPPVLVQETITKFGEVAGMRVPYRISTRQNGIPFAESSVKDFKVNSGLALTDLERRQ